MILFNYSGLRNRDSKIYSVGGYNIAGGFSIQFLYVVGPVFLFFILIGWLLSLLFGLSFFNPFADNFNHIPCSRYSCGLCYVVYQDSWI